MDRAELVEDFLKPATGGANGQVARFRYRDRTRRSRTFDWSLEVEDSGTPSAKKDGAAPLKGDEPQTQAKSITLPDSDLRVALVESTEFPTSTGRLDQYLGEDPIPIAVFKIQAGEGEPVTHMALANLPMVPNVIPSADPSTKSSQAPLAAIHYMVTPTLDPKTNGRFGQIDILAGPDEASISAFSVAAKRVARVSFSTSGRLEKGKPILAFGGGSNMPMTITFQLDKYMPTAIEKQIYEPVVLPKGQMGNGIAACRAEMTVKGQTKEVWLSRSENLDPPPPKLLTFAEQAYEVVYDVDRRPLGFKLKLDDFDMGFEPGTEQPTHYVSQVRLSDPTKGIADEPHTISMNNPLDHRGFTFYQSNYIRMRDPHTGGFTGQFQSIFQVATNPGRPIIYGGCVLVVAGAFIQFYMRAGVFHRRRQERAPAPWEKASQATTAGE